MRAAAVLGTSGAHIALTLAKLPPVVATQLQDGEFWTFYFPLGYVVVVPFLNLLIAALGACWKKIATMRKGSMLKRAATRKVRATRRLTPPISYLVLPPPTIAPVTFFFMPCAPHPSTDQVQPQDGKVRGVGP